MELWIWLGVMVVLIIIEMLTMGLTTIWFAGGALVAAIIAAFNGPLWLQCTLWLAVSIILVIFTRPWAKKHFNYKDRNRTNVEAVIGQKARVIETIDNINGTGTIVINGMEWTARSAGEKTIEPGTIVTVKEVNGVKAIVE